jgi:hypothetical protein
MTDPAPPPTGPPHPPRQAVKPPRKRGTHKKHARPKAKRARLIRRSLAAVE